MHSRWLSSLDWVCFQAFRPVLPLFDPDENIPQKPLKMDWTQGEERMILNWAFANPGGSCELLAKNMGVSPQEISGYLSRRGVTRWHIDNGLRHLWHPSETDDAPPISSQRRE